MTAITIRNAGVLIAFGPNDGTYAPVTPAGCVRTIEADYALVLSEWLARPAPTNADRDADLQSTLDSVKALKALVAVLIQKGVCTMVELRTAYRAL